MLKTCILKKIKSHFHNVIKDNATDKKYLKTAFLCFKQINNAVVLKLITSLNLSSAYVAKKRIISKMVILFDQIRLIFQRMRADRW